MIDPHTESILTELRNVSSKDILFVGIGNSLKADDGIGPEICSQLKEVFPNNVINAGTVPENYLQVIINKAPKVILYIDAIDFGAPAGTIKIFETSELSLAGVTTHTLSPRLFTDMITQTIPVKIYFIGIQPKSMTIGHPISQEAKSAINELLAAFKRLLTHNNDR